MYDAIQLRHAWKWCHNNVEVAAPAFRSSQTLLTTRGACDGSCSAHRRSTAAGEGGQHIPERSDVSNKGNQHEY